MDHSAILAFCYVTSWDKLSLKGKVFELQKKMSILDSILDLTKYRRLKSFDE